MKIISLNKLVEFTQEKGLLETREKRKLAKKNLLKTGNYNLVLICLNTDQEILTRSEPYEVCFYVIDGSGKFTVGHEQADLSKGEILLVPAHMPRGIKSKERLTLLGIQEPH